MTLQLLTPGEHVDIYVATPDNAKAHLRGGGTLPHVTYNAVTDTATIGLSFSGAVQDDKVPEPDSLTELFIPFDPATPAAFEKLISPPASGTQSLATAIHEVAEATLFAVIEFDTFQTRWFTDGFAEAVTLQVLRRWGEDARADAFEAYYERDDFEDLRHRANLRYWLRANFSIDAPTAHESRLRLARYRFAAEEAMGLVDRHGPAIIAEVIDAAAGRPPLDQTALLEVVTEVTGESMDDRLSAYDEYPSAQAAVNAYQAAYLAARDGGDHDAALSSLLRLMEVRFAEDYEMSFYPAAAGLLLQLGEADAGAELLRNHLDAALSGLSSPNADDLRRLLRSRMVDYALTAGRPDYAYEQAETLLARNAMYVDALTIRAHRLHAEGRSTEARALAERLLSDAGDRVTGPMRAVLEPIASASAKPDAR